MSTVSMPCVITALIPCKIITCAWMCVTVFPLFFARFGACCFSVSPRLGLLHAEIWLFGLIHCMINISRGVVCVVAAVSCNLGVFG